MTADSLPLSRAHVLCVVAVFAVVCGCMCSFLASLDQGHDRYVFDSHICINI